MRTHIMCGSVPHLVNHCRSRKMSRPALARAAAILCGNPEFQRFLAYRYPAPWSQAGALPAHNRAASVIYTVCRIQSRRELDTNAEARRKYDRLIGLPYSSWRAAKIGGIADLRGAV